MKGRITEERTSEKVHKNPFKYLSTFSQGMIPGNSAENNSSEVKYLCRDFSNYALLCRGAGIQVSPKYKGVTYIPAFQLRSQKGHKRRVRMYLRSLRKLWGVPVGWRLAAR